MAAIFPMLSHQKCSEELLNSDHPPMWDACISFVTCLSHSSLPQQSVTGRGGRWGHTVKLSIGVITLTPNTNASINSVSIDVTVRLLAWINLNLRFWWPWQPSLLSHLRQNSTEESLYVLFTEANLRGAATPCYASRAWDIEVSHCFLHFLSLSPHPLPTPRPLLTENRSLTN